MPIATASAIARLLLAMTSDVRVLSTPVSPTICGQPHHVVLSVAVQCASSDSNSISSIAGPEPPLLWMAQELAAPLTQQLLKVFGPSLQGSPGDINSPALVLAVVHRVAQDNAPRVDFLQVGFCSRNSVRMPCCAVGMGGVRRTRCGVLACCVSRREVTLEADIMPICLRGQCCFLCVACGGNSQFGHLDSDCAEAIAWRQVAGTSSCGRNFVARLAQAHCASACGEMSCKWTLGTLHRKKGYVSPSAYTAGATASAKSVCAQAQILLVGCQKHSSA